MRFLRDFYRELSPTDRAVVLIAILLALAVGFSGNAIWRWRQPSFGSAPAFTAPPFEMRFATVFVMMGGKRMRRAHLENRLRILAERRQMASRLGLGRIDVSDRLTHGIGADEIAPAADAQLAAAFAGLGRDYGGPLA